VIAIDICLESLVGGAQSDDGQARPGLDPFARVHRNETVVCRASALERLCLTCARNHKKQVGAQLSQRRQSSGIHVVSMMMRYEYKVDASQFRRVDGRALHPLVRSGRSLVLFRNLFER